MTFKTFLQTKAKAVFEKFALSAVIYAEELIGSAAGEVKKEAAINFLLDKLPVYLKPFTAIFKELLYAIADKLIEKAVEKLHMLQEAEISV